MSLKRRISNPPPRLETKTNLALISSKNSAVGEFEVDPLRLERENRQLRLELEDMKKRLRRYEQDVTRAKNTPVRAIPNSKHSTPPALPALKHEITSQTAPRSLNAEPLSIPLMGLHHRRQPGEDDDPRRKKAMSIVKHRDSNDFDDVESPRPSHYMEAGTNLNEFHSEDACGVGRHKNQRADCGDSHHDELGFGSMILDRAGWLVGLLVLQSMSSFIIQRNEIMLQKHLVIVRFLTMLVGAGGNAGNQASVRVIRGLATGSIPRNAVRSFLGKEFAVGLCLSIILGAAGWLRAAAFATPFLETMAITASLFLIVMISVVLGATLPLGMKFVGIDPAHSSTTIQVLMDILGVTITVCVSGLVLGSI